MDANRGKVEDLKAMFPDIGADVILEVLHQKGDDIQKAIDALIAMNYTCKSQYSP
jgi:hypothetical protein